VMLAPYPRAGQYPPDEASEREVGWIQAVVLAVRQIRGEMNIKPAQRIAVLLRGASPEELAWLERHRAYLERLAAIESLTVLAAGDAPPQSATALVGQLTLLVPMAGLIDAEAEAERLAKRLARARLELEKTRGRLANESFVRNAPAAVVSAEREREADLERSAASLAKQLERIRELLEAPAR
jgi:valyl-tRNA synthetase